MCSPVAHGVIGLAVGQLIAANSIKERLWLSAFFVVSAVAADFDFIPGLLFNDTNAWHRGPSHSFVAAAVWGAVSYVVLRKLTPRAALIAAIGALAYASHMALDVLNSDTRAPFGVPLLWPFSDTYSIVRPPFFGGIRHGVPGDDLMTVLKAVFSAHNVAAIGRELLVTTPFLVVSIIVGKLFRAQRH